VLTKQHFRAVADRLDERFRSEGYDLLMVGGQQHEVPGFVEQLPQHLRDRLAGTFPVDPDHIGPNWIRRHAGELLAEYTAGEQRQRVSEVVETLAAGGRAAVGLPDCLRAGALAAIDSLVVEDGAVQPGAVCDNCGWTTPPEEAPTGVPAVREPGRAPTSWTSSWSGSSRKAARSPTSRQPPSWRRSWSSPCCGSSSRLLRKWPAKQEPDPVTWPRADRPVLAGPSVRARIRVAEPKPTHPRPSR
jgi:hypothetical protein